MNAFEEYAHYYDLLYAEKDYAEEANFVLEKLGAESADGLSLLELGCGTGRHAIEFLQRGLNVTGVDVSDSMIALAKQNVEKQVSASAAKEFTVGDVRTLDLADKKYDLIVSLFHVFSYQVDDSDLAYAFATVSKHLAVGGRFLFDFWYGPAVLTDPPEVRVRRLEGGDYSVMRIAEPALKASENRVDVEYEVIFQSKRDNEISRVRETHSMRYLFIPEISRYLDSAGLRICDSGAWMDNRSLDETSWYGWVTAEHKLEND